MSDRARARRGRAVFYHPTAAEAVTQPGDWIGVITDVNKDGTVDLLVDAPNAASFAAALTPVATADAAVQGVGYVQVDVQTIATLANALKTAYNLNVTLVNQLRTAAGRKSSVTHGSGVGQYEYAAIDN
jgi:hypothetical protein